MASVRPRTRASKVPVELAPRAVGPALPDRGGARRVPFVGASMRCATATGRPERGSRTNRRRVPMRCPEDAASNRVELTKS